MFCSSLTSNCKKLAAISAPQFENFREDKKNDLSYNNLCGSSPEVFIHFVDFCSRFVAVSRVYDAISFLTSFACFFLREEQSLSYGTSESYETGGKFQSFRFLLLF